MDRREFLKVTSGAVSGMALLPLFEHSGPGGPAVAPTPAQVVLRPEFTVFATPSGYLSVADRAGLSLGAITGEAFALRARNAQLLGGDACSVDLPPDSGLVGEIPTQAQILAAIPVPFLPIAHHALNNYALVGTEYVMEGLVVPTPLSNGILLPSDSLPLEEQTREGEEGISPNAAVKGKIGNYFWRLSVEQGFIGGCIKRYVWHVGALVRYLPTNSMIFDLHIAGWWQGSTPCFGVYESRSRWCRSRCTWNVWDVVFSLALAAGTMYLAYWLANALAAAIATGTVGLLIAIPGVPPPP